MNNLRVKRTIFNMVFILLVIRIMTLILLEPYIGIANNGDFQRLMIPAGLGYSENVWLEENRDKYFFNYITNDFVFIEPAKNDGWFQVWSIFLRLAILISKMMGQKTFDIRYMGVVNAVFYLCAVYILFWLISHIKGIYSYCLLGIFFFILGDSTVVQYFNSFYSEIGSISSILLLWCLLIYSFLFVKGKGNIYKYIYICIDSIVAFFAILCKKQDILIFFPIVWVFLVMLRRFKVKFLCRVIWFMVFTAIIAIGFSSNKAGGNITAFNVINKEILAISQSPYDHLYQMGFTEQDTKIISGGIGQTAYGEKGSFIWDKYGGFYTRENEIKILIDEPQLFFKLIINRAKSLFKDDDYIGNYMRESGAEPGEKTTKNKLWYKIKRNLYRSNFAFYIGIIIFSISLGSYAIISKNIASEDMPKDVLLLYLMLPCNNILRYLTVIFGDANEDVKHFQILNFEFDFIFILSVFLLLYIVNFYINKRQIAL